MSLRDQLIKAGLVSEDQARRASKQQRKQPNDGKARAQERERAVRDAQAAKAAKDRELEEKRRERAERKARAAEIYQLVDQHRVPPVESDDRFYFVDQGRVKQLAVTPELRARIVGKELCIVRAGGRYALVPPDIAERVRQRDATAVISLESSQDSAAANENDPYRDYVVPDDLMW